MAAGLDCFCMGSPSRCRLLSRILSTSRQLILPRSPLFRLFRSSRMSIPQGKTKNPSIPKRSECRWVAWCDLSLLRSLLRRVGGSRCPSSLAWYGPPMRAPAILLLDPVILVMGSPADACECADSTPEILAPHDGAAGVPPNTRVLGSADRK